MKKHTEETLIAELVDDAFAPFVAMLPPDVLKVFRGELADALEAHPYGSMLVRRALPDPVVLGSGDVARGPQAEVEEAQAKKAGAGKG